MKSVATINTIGISADEALASSCASTDASTGEATSSISTNAVGGRA